MAAHRVRVGRYRVLRRLATGGMGHVFLAEAVEPVDQRGLVVVKTLREHDDDAQRLMFLDEARIASTLAHPHIARVFEVGIDGGTYFLAMEYVEGESLRAVLERAHHARRPLPLDFCVEVIIAAAAGLHHAHHRCGADGAPLGIVHRDVTPSNLMLGNDGAVKVIDFGIAKAARRATSTQAGAVKGKTGYLAPEQVVGGAIDHRVDVWALGVVLYELVTLSRAFAGGNDYDVMQRISTVTLPRPSVRAPSVPRELEDVILRALAREPADRYADTAALGAALAAVANQRGLTRGPAVVRRTLAELFDLPVVVPVIDESSSGRRRRLARGTGDSAPHALDFPEDDDVQGTTMRWEWAAPLVLPSKSPPPIAEASAQSLLETVRSPGAAAAHPPRIVVSTSVAAITPPRLPRSRSTSVVVLPSPPSSSSRPALSARATVWRDIGALVGIAAATAALVLGAWAWLTPATPVAALPALATAVPALAPPAPPAEVVLPMASLPPPRTQLWLRVTSEPAGATVLLDGARLGRTPLTIELPRRAGTATLKVRRHGVARKRTIALDGDVVEHVVLERR